MNEKNYDFLKRFREIHKPGRRCDFSSPHDGEIMLDASWSIAVDRDASPMILRAAKDLQDYFFTSMNLSLRIEKIPGTVPPLRKILLLNTGKALKQGAFTLSVSPDVIRLDGDDDRAVLYGSVHLEDRMNLREGPYLAIGTVRREPLLRMRQVHSGSGIDDFPDWQLNAILHAGFTAIDLFIRGIDTNARGEYCNVNDIIERASSFGLDTVLYNYTRCFKHPDDPDAEEVFDRVYGDIFRACPGARAISFVGESLEFPSKDPSTTGKRFSDSASDGIPDIRPSPGWYPCSDYPALLKRISDTIRRVKPDAEIIFSTYNWCYASEELRRYFLENIPKNLTVNVAFDMLRTREIDGVKLPVMDYSISATEPGEYFKSETALAHANGLRIRCTANTAGLTWDFGAIPYIPVPQLWLKRMQNLKPYVLERGVDSFYECHHFGWWPESPAVDLAKQVFFTGTEDCTGEFLFRLARRDYGREAAPAVVSVWEKWSEAVSHIVTSNEDQYGPLRVGPAYPFIFHFNVTRTLTEKSLPFPCGKHAYMGNAIIRTFYRPFENENQSPAMDRYPIEIREMHLMHELMEQGLTLLASSLPEMPPGRKHENGERLYGIGKYMANTAKTVLNIKEWYLKNMEFMMERNPVQRLVLLDELDALLENEKENVLDTIPYVLRDSRLGWEPSMEYVCDEWHLEWKLRQLEATRREMETARILTGNCNR
ncbi:MAG: hypothetical protein BWY31_01550 [Lentisphaerae bacterium ADurb.Bin242]|nr:MAG: hypothetical protein BWY31_01550 [Lentisphaerae bacterium ADurb.Bin242]